MLTGKNRRFVIKAKRGFSYYISAIVLGLNDALVEMTGALAGFTMVLSNNNLIILAGFSTGIAATLSMAASEFFAQTVKEDCTHPRLCALVTGTAYLLTVAFLLLPYLLFEKPIISLACCLFFGSLIIIAFTYFESRIRQTKFVPLCLQMLAISFGVAAISFTISWLAKTAWGIDL